MCMMQVCRLFAVNAYAVVSLDPTKEEEGQRFYSGVKAGKRGRQVM